MLNLRVCPEKYFIYITRYYQTHVNVICKRVLKSNELSQSFLLIVFRSFYNAHPYIINI